MNKRTQRQAEYAGVEVRMTKAEFYVWAIPEFEVWLATRPDETPTIDRIAAGGHYEIGNIRLLEWGENARRARRNHNVHAPAGQAWCGQCREYKPREAFDKNATQPHGLQGRCKTCREKERVRRTNPNWRNNTAPAGQAWCSACQTYQPTQDFYVSRTAKSGLQGSCKASQNSGRSRKKRE